MILNFLRFVRCITCTFVAGINSLDDSSSSDVTSDEDDDDSALLWRRYSKWCQPADVTRAASSNVCAGNEAISGVTVSGASDRVRGLLFIWQGKVRILPHLRALETARRLAVVVNMRRPRSGFGCDVGCLIDMMLRGFHRISFRACLPSLMRF